ncbi:Protein CASP, partial [Cucurbita argyrosperma subsp. argyrosperma]
MTGIFLRQGVSFLENVDRKHFPLDQDQSSMLKVICSQRDRFRTRLHEAEEELRQLKEKVGQLTVELEKTKADNVKLYGKIRYVQYYNHEKVVSRGSKKHGEDLESGSMSDVEFKYKKIYEDDTRKVFPLETRIVVLKFRYYSSFPLGQAHIAFGQFSLSFKQAYINIPFHFFN